MNVWKDIKGYEGIYKVNSAGDVLSVKRNKILKTSKTNNGYKIVVLSKDGKTECKLINRLVADAFCIGRTNERNYVNHIDSDRNNNNSNNLEWCTCKENTLHAIKKGSFKRLRKPVIATNIETSETIIFSSMSEASRFGFEISNISSCCNGAKKTHKGYFWNYVNDNKTEVLL